MTDVKKARGEMTAAELAKEVFTPRERVGIAMGRLQKMAWGDPTTDWKPMIDDGPMSEDVMKELEGICEILQNAMKPMKPMMKAMAAEDMPAYIEAEMAKATTELNDGKREIAQKRMQHLRRELTKATTAFDSGATHADVQLFSEAVPSPSEAVAALAKQVEQLETKAAETPAPTPEAAPADPPPAAPAADPPPNATPVEAAKAATDDDNWPDDFASPEEIRKAKEWKPSVADDAAI